VLLAQGLLSIYSDDDEYIKLPKAMERAFHAAIDAKALSSDVEPKSYRDAMRRPDSELWHQAMVRKMEAHLENGTWECWCRCLWQHGLCMDWRACGAHCVLSKSCGT
jgi:hypothetical protein